MCFEKISLSEDPQVVFGSPGFSVSEVFLATATVVIDESISDSHVDTRYLRKSSTLKSGIKYTPFLGSIFPNSFRIIAYCYYHYCYFLTS